jgi:hypothetical protein
MRRLLGRLIGLAVLLILAVAIGYGQTRDVTLETRTTAGCPALVKAKYVPSARLVPVAPKASASMEAPTWPLYVDFTPTLGKVVVQARITVRGISAQGGVIPAAAGDAQGPWLAQTFEMSTASKDGSKAVSGTVWLTGYGAIESVRLDWAMFADGTTWTSSPQQRCYAAQTATKITSN